MPTTSALSDYNIVNLGPLTTTYSAPASCLTETAHKSIASIQAPGFAYESDSCDPRTYSDCLPSGTDYDSLVMAASDEPTRTMVMPYYSPGLACPSDWYTAGVAEKDGDGSVSVTGVFSTDTWVPLHQTTTHATPFYNPKPNIFVSAMDEGETAVLCCPTEFTADPNGGCYKNFPVSELQQTSRCALIGGPAGYKDTFEWFGETITGESYSIASSNTWSDAEVTRDTERLTSQPSEYHTFTGMTFMPMITLVSSDWGDDGPGELGIDDDNRHQFPDEGDQYELGLRDGSDSDSDSGSDSNGDDDSDSAAVWSGVSVSDSLCVLMGIWGMATLVGGAFFAPL